MATAVAGTFTEEFVEVAGVRVQLRKGGEGEPLLILHSELGVPGWLRAYAELAEHFTVYVPSLPGFGRSGREDKIIPLDACRLFQRAIKGARASVLEKCGHMLEMEQPEAFVKGIREFLATAVAQGAPV